MQLLLLAPMGRRERMVQPCRQSSCSYSNQRRLTPSSYRIHGCDVLNVLAG